MGSFLFKAEHEFSWSRIWSLASGTKVSTQWALLNWQAARDRSPFELDSLSEIRRVTLMRTELMTDLKSQILHVGSVKNNYEYNVLLINLLRNWPNRCENFISSGSCCRCECKIQAQDSISEHILAIKREEVIKHELTSTNRLIV